MKYCAVLSLAKNCIVLQTIQSTRYALLQYVNHVKIQTDRDAGKLFRIF